MLVMTPAWKSEDGKTHTDYLTALRYDLACVLKKAGDNEVTARKIVEYLTKETITEITDILEKIEEEMAEPTKFQVVRS